MNTSRVHIHEVAIHWGDCDPAGIVFYPNFYRWMDAASLAFFRACGLPTWAQLERTRGIVGTPLLEIHTKFVKTATYGEVIQIHTSVDEWAGKTFRHQHRVMRGETLLCEGTERRCFVQKHPQEPGRLQAIPVPGDILAMCQTPAANAPSTN